MEPIQEEKQSYITIDDVTKVELRIGTILQAEAVPESEKLIKLQVDLGEAGKRQVIAGIAPSYTSEQLVDKQAIFVSNIKPRKMLGMESQGMMLIARDQEDKIQIISPSAPVPNGTRLQ